MRRQLDRCSRTSHRGAHDLPLLHIILGHTLRRPARPVHNRAKILTPRGHFDGPPSPNTMGSLPLKHATTLQPVLECDVDLGQYRKPYGPKAPCLKVRIDSSFLGSPCAIVDLVAGMLDKNPNKRLTLEQIAKHPWVASHEEQHRLAPAQSMDTEEMCGEQTCTRDPSTPATAPLDATPVMDIDSDSGEPGLPGNTADSSILLSWPLGGSSKSESYKRKLSNIKQQMSWSKWTWPAPTSWGKQNTTDSPSKLDTNQ
eukprot:1178394-Prorocentrum_minimum.AAC.2